VQLIDGAEHTVKTVTKIIELHQHSESSSIALIHTDVQRALHADGALLVECSVRYLQPPLKPTTTASLLRYRPDDSTHRDDLRQLSTNGLFSDFAIKVSSLPPLRPFSRAPNHRFRSATTSSQCTSASWRSARPSSTRCWLQEGWRRLSKAS
jgi:hypothetical protein